MSNKSDITMKKQSLRDVVAPIIGESSWSFAVEDELNGLVILDSANGGISTGTSLKGTVVDVDNKFVFVRGSTWAADIHASALVPEEENLFLEDELREIVNLKDWKFSYGFEGVVIRCIKWGGKVYRITHRKLDPEAKKSSWCGGGKPFIEIYWSLGGPKDAELFPESCQYSPWVYRFVAVHPDLLTASRQEIGEGYLALVGIDKAWEPSVCPYPLEEVDQSETPLKGFTTSPAITPGVIHEVQELTLEQANAHLAHGWHPTQPCVDMRLTQGEFVVAWNGSTICKILSRAYLWRKGMRQEDPNHWHAFFLLCEHARSIDIQSIVPLLRLKSPGDIVLLLKSGPILYMEEARVTPPLKENIHTIWQACLLAFPLHLQKVVSTYKTRYATECTALVSWLTSLAVQHKMPEHEGFNPLSVNILSACIKALETSRKRPLRQRGKRQARMGDFVGSNEQTLYNESVVLRVLTRHYNNSRTVWYNLIRVMKVVTGPPRAPKEVPAQEIAVE